jgi:hypothetical protein
MNMWMNRIEQRVMVKSFFLSFFLSERTREQTHPQGTCEYTSGQCDFTVHRQELSQEIQIGDLSCGDEEWPGSSALSEEVSLCECSSNGRALLGGLSYHQEHS